jgi:2-methylcitrate dehydratase PrpD
VTEDQSRIEVELENGQKLSRFVEQSLGNIHRPLSDRQLEDKLRDQAVDRISEKQVDELIELCWTMDELREVEELVRRTIPQ